VTADAYTLHVIDDDASWRVSVERLMRAAGYRVALYESAEEFLERSRIAGPGCILLDLRMPGLDGLQLQQRLVEARHQLPVIFLSGHGDIPTSVTAMRTGAEDFLTKPVETDVLLNAVERAIARDREAVERRQKLDAMRSRVDALTPTERKVFALVVRGMLNKRIAAELDTAERTIKWHRQHIMQKLQVESLAEMVSLAERLGLVDHPDRGTAEPG
jgi:FixJ family two-component response regulator